MSDLSDLSDLSDKKGAPVFALTGYAVASQGIPRGFVVPQYGLAQSADLPQGMQGNLMATVVCVSRRRGACIRLIRLIRLIKLMMGAPCDTPWVCLPQWGMTRAKIYRLGGYCSSAPPNKNLVFLVFLASAARLV